MSTKVRIPKSKIPALSDQLSPEERQTLDDAGYGGILELIDLLHEKMWERFQEDGWLLGKEWLVAWLVVRIRVLPENESSPLRVLWALLESLWEYRRTALVLQKELETLAIQKELET